VEIEGVTNSAEGGSGQFIIETRRRYNNVIDRNEMFGVVGIVAT
jgi:hypothetical protein